MWMLWGMRCTRRTFLLLESVAVSPRGHQPSLEVFLVVMVGAGEEGAGDGAAGIQWVDTRNILSTPQCTGQRSVVAAQSLGRVRLFETPGTVAR